MTADDSHDAPWADVSLPSGFDAREIYEYATTVGEVRRQQRKQRQTVLTALSCIVVIMAAVAIVLSRSDASSNIRVAGVPASDPAANAAPLEPSTPTTDAEPQAEDDGDEPGKKSPTEDFAFSAPRQTSPRCRVVPMSTRPYEIELVAMRTQVPDTTTTTEAPTTTTTAPPPPPPPRTTTTMKPTPPTTTTTIVISPEPPVSLPPLEPSGPPSAPRPDSRCD